MTSSESPSDYERGYSAGYSEAVDREHVGDATSTADGPTWFVVPRDAILTTAEATAYERGWLAGWADYFEGRQP